MSRIPWTHPLHLVLGLTVWSLWFVAVYSGFSLACQWLAPADAPGPFNPVTAATLAGGVLVALALLWAGWKCWRVARGASEQDSALEQEGVVAGIAAGLYLLSALAALAIVLPGLVMVPCL